jgi:hypothetical protein
MISHPFVHIREEDISFDKLGGNAVRLHIGVGAHIHMQY